MKPGVDTSATARLRMKDRRALSIVLVRPEIPQNTGNIARLCAATGACLHLVGELGFSIDEKAVRRAGLDYWHLVDVSTHDTLDDCLKAIGTDQPIVFSSKARQSYLTAPFKEDSALVFGSESVGLSADILARYEGCTYGIPTLSHTVRSLNLANSVSIGLYRALEVTGALARCALVSG